MNKLQLLALNHIKNLADQLDNESINLGITLNSDKVVFDAPTHTYPIASKSRRIASWAEAILESDTK